MKILFIVNVDWFFISHRLPVALAAIDAGYEVHLATNFTDQKSYIESLGIRAHDVPFSRSGSKLWHEIKTIIVLHKVFSRVSPDLAHGVTIKPVLYGGVLSKIFKNIPFVAAVSGLGLVFVADGVVAKIRKFFVKFLYKIALSGDRIKVIFQNSLDRETLAQHIGLTSQQCELIAGSGVDLSQYSYLPEPDHNPVVVMASRLLVEKGVNEFIAAAEIIKQRHAKVTFKLIGEPDFGNPNAVTLKQFNEWREDGVVELTGYRDDVKEIFQQSHLVVLPSYYGEGLPKVLIEAAACGRAVVTTENAGCKAAIIPGVTGIAIPIKDPLSLAEAILELLEDPVKRMDMGREGRRFAESEFSIQKVVARHVEIYSEIINK